MIFVISFFINHCLCYIIWFYSFFFISKLVECRILLYLSRFCHSWIPDGFIIIVILYMMLSLLLVVDSICVVIFELWPSPIFVEAVTQYWYSKCGCNPLVSYVRWWLGNVLFMWFNSSSPFITLQISSKYVLLFIIFL